MKLYDVALQIFLKRTTGGFVNDSTLPGFESEMRAAIELAALFMRVKDGYTAPKPTPIPRDATKFPGDEL